MVANLFEDSSIFFFPFVSFFEIIDFLHQILVRFIQTNQLNDISPSNFNRNQFIPKYKFKLEIFKF